MASNKIDEFTISSGRVPTKSSHAGDGIPQKPHDCGMERNPEFKYPPTSKLPDHCDKD
jgi:hypothetical protein